MTDFDEVIKKKQAWKKKLRDNEARALKSVRNILNEQDKEPIDEDSIFSRIVIIGLIAIIIAILCVIFSPNAHAWTDEEIVSAIYLAEGGKNAQYPYGIRSVRCNGESQCRRIAMRTVANNRIRFAKQNRYKDYISFLGSRYCPTKGRLSRAEKKVNKHWVKNVLFYLKKGA